MLLVIVGMSLSGAFSKLGAQGSIYHFSGTLVGVQSDDAGLIRGNGLLVGSPVEFSVFVNFNQPGTTTLYDGSTEVLQDVVPQLGSLDMVFRHFFYSALVGGNYLQDTAAEQLRPAGGRLSLNYGEEYLDNSLWMGRLTGGGVSYGLTISKLNAGSIVIGLPLPWGVTTGNPTVPAWQLGEHVLAISSGSDVNSLSSQFSAEMTLDQITEVSEPRPVVLVMAGMCLAALPIFGRSFRSSTFRANCA